MMPLVSVIIPIYNTKEFLCKCIDSVLNQTLSNIEILLIDDGSSDGSGEICDNYTYIDKRVRVIHIPNQGASHARNEGIEIAQGEYIYFIDSDDWIENNMILTLYKLIKKNGTDLSTCGYIIEEENGNPLYKIHEESTYVLDKWDAMYSLFHDKYYKYKGNIWDKLYSKEIIKNNNLKFDETIYYNEDRLFIFQYLSYCQSVSYTTTPYYHYIMRNSSAMNSYHRTYNKKMCTFMDAFDIMTSLSKSYPHNLKRALSIDYIQSSISFFIRYSHYIPSPEIRSRLMKIRKYNFKDLSYLQKVECLLRYTNFWLHTTFEI